MKYAFVMAAVALLAATGLAQAAGKMGGASGFDRSRSGGGQHGSLPDGGSVWAGGRGGVGPG